MEICWVTMKVCQLIGKWRLRSRLGQRERMCYGIGLRSEGPGRTPLYDEVCSKLKKFYPLNLIL